MEQSLVAADFRLALHIGRLVTFRDPAEMSEDHRAELRRYLERDASIIVGTYDEGRTRCGPLPPATAPRRSCSSATSPMSRSRSPSTGSLPPGTCPEHPPDPTGPGRAAPARPFQAVPNKWRQAHSGDPRRPASPGGPSRGASARLRRLTRPDRRRLTPTSRVRRPDGAPAPPGRARAPQPRGRACTPHAERRAPGGWAPPRPRARR